MFPPACLPGSYGESCSRSCSCAQGASCHHVSGQCGCPAGFTGSGCEKSESSGAHLCLWDGIHLKFPSFYKWTVAVLVRQLVFQELLGQTVIRCASAQSGTSSATRCLDRVTALQAFMASSVSKVCSPLTSTLRGRADSNEPT